MGRAGWRRAALRAVVGSWRVRGIVQELEFGDGVLLEPGADSRSMLQRSCVRRGKAGVSSRKSRNAPFSTAISTSRTCRGSIRRRADPAPAMVQTFLDRSLCARVETAEGTKLVFPAYFRHDRPESAEQPNVVVTYGFAGTVDEIYTTLVVRLHYTNEFGIERLWRYAADFKPFCGGRAGLLLIKSRRRRS